MDKKTKSILSGVGIAAAGIALKCAVSYIVTTKLVKIAIDRNGADGLENSSIAKNQLRGFADTDDFLEKWHAAAEALLARDTETVEITAADGTKLVGHWYPCESPKRVILAMHGWRSSWAKDFGMIADFWHNNNCSVLFAEQRGQGGSGGEYMGFGLTERFDCQMWAKWINETKTSELPVYLAGISMGAATVMMAANLEMPGNVHGIIADCGFTSAHAIWKHVTENNLHLIYGLKGFIADDICRKKLHVGSRDFSTADALKETKLPVLFIHGTDDHFVPVEMTYENYKACASPKRLFIVPGADHGMSYCSNREGYEAALRDFWKEFDNRSPKDEK